MKVTSISLTDEDYKYLTEKCISPTRLLRKTIAEARTKREF